jgi:phosphoglycolate phosphatase
LQLNALSAKLKDASESSPRLHEKDGRMNPNERTAGEQRAVLFDVDGVLLDSLPAHLAICRDKSQEFGCPLDIPNERQLRDMVRRGAVISPMKEFFRTVGFSDELAARADEDYEREFGRRYSCPPFVGIPELLQRLADAGVLLGLVSSNTLENVTSGLGVLMQHFGNRAFTRDHPRQQSKAAALSELLGQMQVDPRRAVYVGDQPADARAAQQAGMNFLGVTYGWGLGRGDLGLRTVDNPSELGSELLASLNLEARARTGTYV